MGIQERHGNTYPARNRAGRNRKSEKAVNIDYTLVTFNRYINVMKKLEKAILENPQRVALARQTPLTLAAI